MAGARSPIFSRKQVGGVYVFTDETQTTGNIFFVDSGATNNGTATGFGVNPDAPFSTTDAAIAACVDNNGDRIFLMPGHVEDFAAAEGWDADKAGISIISLGEGADRARFDFNDTAALCVVSANNVTLKNLTFRASVPAVVIGLDVQAGATNLLMDSCEFIEGETAATDEFLISVDLKAGCQDARFKNCIFREDDGTSPNAAISLTDASDRVHIEDCTFMAPYAVAAVSGVTTLSEDILIARCNMKVADGQPGIELLTGTTGIIRDNRIASTGLAPASMIVADACDWFENFGNSIDGRTGIVIGTAST